MEANTIAEAVLIGLLAVARLGTVDQTSATIEYEPDVVTRDIRNCHGPPRRQL